MAENYKKIAIRNTIVNYAIVFWQLATVIFTTRIIYLGLGEELYGYWTLLWSLFGYAVLLDFGFGRSVQKYTAEVVINENYKKYNGYISTIIFYYTLMAVAVVILTALGTVFLTEIFKFKDLSLVGYAKQVFMILGVGIAITFPTGIFPEILNGLQRSDLKNYIFFITSAANLLGIYLIFKLGYSLMTLATFSVILNITANLIMVVIIKFKLPKFKLSFSRVKLSNTKEIGSFSFFTYIYNLAEMVIMRTDKIVLGIMLGMDSVAIYQLGTRISELMNNLTTRFQDTLPAIAASIHATDDKEKLKWILIRSCRFSAFITMGAYVILTLLANQILFIWLKVQNQNATYIAYIMLTSTFLIVLFRSSQLNFMQMAGEHKVIAYIGIAESLANIILSVILVKIYGILGVAIGTLIPSLLISLFVVYPLMVKFTQAPALFIFKHVYLMLLPAAIPTIVCLVAFNYYIPLKNWNVFYLFAALSSSGIIHCLSSYVLYFTKEEKEKYIKQSIQKIIQKLTPSR